MDWIHIERDIQGYTETEKKALALLREGKSHFQIAFKLHVSFEHAREIVFDIRKKESLIMGKLTDQQRADIYQAWKDGTTQKELAQKYGVCNQAISQLIKKMNTQKPEPVELEDVENGIPNTPLMPQRKPAQINQEFEASIEQMVEDVKKKSAIEVKNAENAEKKSVIAKIPECVKRACDQRIKDLDEEISIRSARIEDLKYEVEQFADELRQIRAWRDSQL